jgi:hypothetical protein
MSLQTNQGDRMEFSTLLLVITGLVLVVFVAAASAPRHTHHH